MGKRGMGKNNNGSSSNWPHTNLSIREEASGKKQSHNPKSLLKLNHLQNLSVWASGYDQIGGLGAFFGHSFAEFGQTLGIPPDPSLFPCQRCETILQPGSNCTVRIEKNQPNRRRHAKVKTPVQNNVVYSCHFCSHRNLKRGTYKGYMKEIAPSKVISSNNEPRISTLQKCSTTNSANASKATDTMEESTATPSQALSNPTDFPMDSPVNPTTATSVKLLESKRKRKKPGPKKSGDETSVGSAPADIDKGGGTSKKKRKSWTSLKEIAENEERERNKRFMNFSIPFTL